MKGYELVQAVITAAQLDGAQSMFFASSIDDCCILTAFKSNSVDAIVATLKASGMNLGQILRFISCLDACVNESYVTEANSTPITEDWLKSTLGDLYSDAYLQSLTKEKITTLGQLRQLSSKQLSALDIPLAAELKLTVQLRQTIEVAPAPPSEKTRKSSFSKVHIRKSSTGSENIDSEERIKKRTSSFASLARSGVSKSEKGSKKKEAAQKKDASQKKDAAQKKKKKDKPSTLSRKQSIAESAKKLSKSANVAFTTYESTGSVYVSGVYYQTHQNELKKFMERITKGKRTKPLFEYLKSAGVQLTHSPEEPKLVENVSKRAGEICCSDNTIAVHDGSELYMSGAEQLFHGILGTMNTDAEQGLAHYNIVTINNVISISSGPSHTIAGLSDGKVYGWGMNQAVIAGPSPFQPGQNLYGLLGQEKTQMCPSPTLIEGATGDILQVCCGRSHSVILTTDGIFTCGVSAFGALGRQGDQWKLQVVEFKEPEKITQIACGAHHSIALSDKGGVFGFGCNTNGETGVGEGKVGGNSPKSLDTICDIKAVACGDHHSILLDVNGNVYACGSNDSGQLGIGKKERKVFLPVKVELPARIVKVRCGPSSTIAVSDRGEVWAWGMLFAPGMTGIQETPRRLDKLRDLHLWISKADAGITHRAFIADTKLTECLHTLIQYCALEEELKLGFVKNKLLSIPSNMVSKLEDRAVSHLCNTAKGDISSIDKNFISFLPKIKTRQTLKIFQVENTGDKRVYVKVHLDDTEKTQNSRYSFNIEPTEFQLEKKQTQIVRIQLICNRPPSETTNYIVVLNISKTQQKRDYASERHTKRQSTKDLKHTAARSTLRRFIIMQVAPKDLVIKQAVDSEQLVADLSAYIPYFVIKDVARKPGIPTEPNVAKFDACILFIDVSGFTALNERLAKLGPAGPEQVSKHLNAYFGQLIDAVNAHGGDVLKFAGDALICMFGDDRNLEDAKTLTMRAIQCALVVQTEHAKYDSNQGFVLTLHVGIGVGEMYSLYVGGVDSSWEFLVVGEAFLQLKTSVDASKTGEVVVSQECWDLVNTDVVGEERGVDWLVTEVKKPIEVESAESCHVDPKSSKAMRCYIPKGVQVRLDSRQAQWLAELRKITVLFVKLDSLTYTKGEPFDSDAVHSVLRYMQSVVFRYEGMVRQFLVDDKGTVLIAAFGVPPFSHEDDTVRGLKAAIEIHENLKKQEMINSIGVTTGNAFCGAVGSQTRREYAMVGDIVNLSARLMVAAGKQKAGVLCDHITYESSTAKLEFKKLEPIMVKGKSQPIQIYIPSEKDEVQEVLEAANEDQAEKEVKTRTVIGREIELSTIKNAITALCKENNGGIIVLEGPAGIGKSMLVGYTREVVLDVGGGFFRYFPQTIEGAGDAVEKNTPFFMWKKVLKQLLYLDQYLGKGEDVRVRMVTNLKKEADKSFYPFFPLINTILPLGLSDTEQTKDLSAGQRNLHLRKLIKHMLAKRRKKRPLIILLDDFQSADSASIELALDIANELKDILMIISARPFQAPQQFKDICSLPTTTVLQLKGMLPTECVDIVCNSLKLKELPDSVKSQIAKADGNPLFSEELVIGLRDAGVIEIQDGIVNILQDMDKVEIPTTVQGMITSRMDRLPAAHQMVLKVASVIGLEFSKQMLIDVYPIEEEKEEIKIFMRLLISENFILKRTSPTGIPLKGQYTFKNDIIQKVAYSRMLFLQRQKLHKRIAEEIEKQEQDNIDAFTTVLAHHWTHALEGADRPDQAIVTKACHYLQKSINESLSNNQDPSESLDQTAKIIAHFTDKKEKEKWSKIFQALKKQTK